MKVDQIRSLKRLIEEAEAGITDIEDEIKARMTDDIMYVLVGGDIRPRVIEALQFLVGKLRTRIHNR